MVDRNRVAALGAGLLLIMTAGACSATDRSPEPVAAADRAAAPPATEAADLLAGRPFPVQTTTRTFVDDSRPTDYPDDRPDLPTRSLETRLYVPQGDGPFPLVVQAHGFNGHPRKYTELGMTWAEAGYVVALPAFPLTNDTTPGGAVFQDYVNQPADLSFVIDQVLALSQSDDPVLGGRVDPERIGVSGHSLGGATAYGIAFNDCCRDDRIDAVTLMSTLPLPFDGGTYDFSGTPLLMLQLTEDPVVPYDAATTTYAEAASPKFLVTLEGGVHPEPYEDAPSPFDDVVMDTTIAFWDAYLVDDADAVDRLVMAAVSTDITSITDAP